MQDLFAGLGCLMLGLAPFGLVGGLLWLLQRSAARPLETDPRFAELERHVAHLTHENLRLAHRVQAVESWLSAERARAPQPATAQPATAQPATQEIERAVVIEAPAARDVIAVASVETPVEAAAEPVQTTGEPAVAAVSAVVVETEPVSASVPNVAPVAPPVPPAPSIALPPPPPPRESVPPPASADGGLERWLGVRGMAALGAIVLAIAGLYFFEYSIEHGLIGPTMRVILGVLAGVGCVAASEWPLRTRAPVLSSWLAGAGIAILYTATWAAHGLYGLVPAWASGALMVLVTVTAVALSQRRDSIATAVLGLTGGFVTPLALSTGEDHPIPLFSYLLLLDVGILWVAHRKKWPVLGWLALVATGLYQMLWLFGRMSADTSVIGLVVILAFAVVFTAFGATRRHETDDEALPSHLLTGASVLMPFFFALSFVGRDVLSPHLYAVGGLLLVLSIAALAVARFRKLPPIALGAAAGSIGVVLAWLASHPLDTWLAWELAALLACLALVFHVGAELERESAAQSGAAIVLLFGGLGVSLVASLTATTSIWPFIALPVVLVILAARLGELPGRGWVQLGSGVGLALALVAVEHMPAADAPSPSFLVTLASVLVTLLAVPALVRRSEEGRDFADHGAAAAALALLVLRFALPSSLSLTLDLGVALVLSVLVHLAATRRSQPAYAAAALALIGFGSMVWIFERGSADDALVTLALLGASVVLHALWPSIAGAHYRSSPWAWRAAALAGPVYFLALRTTWTRALGTEAIGLLPVLLAAVSLVALLVARARGPSEQLARRTALVWPAAVTAGFVTLAIPLQLSNEWLTIGWALEAVALLVIYRRLEHPGLKWLAALLFSAVAVRLLINPYVLGYYPRGEIRIFNWLAYTYLVPAAALVGAYVALADVEGPRLNELERAISPKPWLAQTFFAAALVTVFVWLNLTIVDWYASGPALTIPMERMPARDLTISIAWGVYALLLLGLGMWRQSSGLRWTSLALVLVTCGKVFLYDLGHLEDLYRVASLVGLAFSLLAISLVYQRFVFRPRNEASEVPS